MMKPLVLSALLIISLSLAGCARPNYKDPAKPEAQSQKPQDPDSPSAPPAPVCELFLNQKRLCVSFNWLTQPDTQNFGSFEFKFFAQETPDTSVSPTGGVVSVLLWMPSMGHGSSPVTLEKIKDGEYKATQVFFIMPGSWEIHIQIKNDKTVVDEVVKKFNL